MGLERLRLKHFGRLNSIQEGLQFFLWQWLKAPGWSRKVKLLPFGFWTAPCRFYRCKGSISLLNPYSHKAIHNEKQLTSVYWLKKNWTFRPEMNSSSGKNTLKSILTSKAWRSAFREWPTNTASCGSIFFSLLCMSGNLVFTGSSIFLVIPENLQNRKWKEYKLCISNSTYWRTLQAAYVK